MKFKSWQRYLPGIALFRNYRRGWLQHDVGAGISVAAIQIPTAIAYAQLAGFPPIMGLYACVLPLLVYALFGSSRHLIIGPDSATCAMLAATLIQLATPRSEDYMSLALILTLFIGIGCVLGGIFRLGFIADFISRPILTGFLAGVGITIIIGQGAGLTRMEVDGGTALERLLQVLRQVEDWHWGTMGIGVSTILLLILLKKWKRTKTFGTMLVVIAAIITAWGFQLDEKGIQIVGSFSTEPLQLSIPEMSSNDWKVMFEGGLGILLVGYCSAMLPARGFAARRGYEIRPNQEFLALGAANIASAISGGFAVSGADSRTAINYQAGGRSQVSGLVSAFCAAVGIFIFPQVFSWIPAPVLAGILIVAGWLLIDMKAISRYYGSSRSETAATLVAIIGVLLLGVIPGILTALILNMLRLLVASSRPHDAILGRVPGLDGYHDIEGREGSEVIPGLLIYRFDAPLVFFNAEYFKRRLFYLVDHNPTRVRWIIYDAETAGLLDITAIEILQDILRECKERNIVFTVARANGKFKDMFERTKFDQELGEEYLFASIRSGVKAYENTTEQTRQ